jgi:tRNA dimethylallyltransferase
LIRIAVIVGPTASGKTALALRLAAVAAPAEIVSADSQQVYRGMDIGTGKAGAAERAAAPHHLVDVATPAEVMTAARWVELADAAIAGARARGAVPIVCGGTGLYVRALLHGLFAGPGADADLRARLEAEGAAALHARLGEVDPEAAARIDARDLRRLVRALEVWELTGVTMTAHQRAHDYRTSPRRYDARLVGLDPPRAALRRAIDARVDGMIAAGLAAEVQGLVAAGYPLSLRAFDAIGYREMRAHLAGQTTLAEAAEAIKAATRRYARRQLGWFRSEAGVAWYKDGRDVDVDDLATWLRAEDTA